MQRHHESDGRVSGIRRVALLSVVLAVVGGMFSGAATAVADSTCPTPPAVFPVHDLHPGMTATGSTVLQGTTQTPFDVEILGVQPDGIGPGVDFILAKITGPQSFLDSTGGIVAGMSGSPVMVGGQLVGSTSYGFEFSDQTVIGITPAQPMVDLFSYPDPQQAAAIAAARTVQLSPALRAAGARATGKSRVNAFPAQAVQLSTPLEVSGLDQRGIARLQRYITNRLHLPLTVFGTTASTGGIASSPLQAGDSLAAAISYGDVTAGAIGTATVTCGDMVVGFGHPFGFTGPSALGMNGADVLQVIKDPSSTFGGFKFAVITGLHGTIDQDRLEGIRGIEGELPDLRHIVTHAANLDIPGRVHDGGSQVADPEFLPIVSALSLLSGEDAAFDRIGDGSVHAGWTVRGTVDGQPFKLQRDNRFYSGFDATQESIFELLFELSSMQSPRFGDVSITSVRTNAQVTQDQLTTAIRSVQVSSGLQPGLADRRILKVRPGDTIHVRVQLVNHGSTHPATVNIAIPVSANASSGGELNLGSGGIATGGRASSFDALLRSIENAPHQYDLVADLSLNKGGGVVVPGEAAAKPGSIHKEVVVPRDRVVTGRHLVDIRVVRPNHGPPPSPSPSAAP
ncbi:MAG TPA: SpoIVB peptidase S55 domain-containing protein [Actinomycetota bacterium]|nr:SpoIVB peptidase S55 domain-containing protein [Actinomycetota bacterium]